VDAKTLRTTFDESPDVYDRLRPVASRQVFDDLVALARLERGARLVEIGCGTGQATLPLAERGFDIVAVELGQHLAEYTRRKLARFSRVHVAASSFEDWDPGGDRFDAVVSFNAFHWIDPEVRFAKSAAVLRRGGRLAVVDMHYVTPDDADPLWVALQDDYEAVLGPSARSAAPPHPDAVDDRSSEIHASGYFRDVAVCRYLETLSFSADEYIALLGTSSWHRRLDRSARQALFERLERRIREHPRQSITPPLLTILDVAQRV
jgi:SAM-dependent methyltransferase